MKITVAGETYEYDASTLLNTEAIALQQATGMRPPEFGKALELGDAIALTGLVWLVWRRSGKTVAFADVEFDLGAIDVEDDAPKADAAA